MKFAVLLVFVAFVAIQVQYSAGEEFVCQENVPYIENECNGCFCSPTGKLGCTYKGCFGPRYSELHSCEVGTTFQKDCNKCWCVKDLGTICTNNKC